MANENGNISLLTGERLACVQLTDSQKQFIREQAAADLSRLLLSASRYAVPDVPFLVEQIAARRQIQDKLPSWYANAELIFPARIAAEQCSSEATACYKQRLIKETDHLCDLTGGLGIDSYFFSRKAERVTYIERFAAYCAAARHNFAHLGADNITVINADTTEYLPQLPAAEVYYIDPARRGTGNKRLFALTDCEPNLPQLLPSLLARAPRLIAKLSPMADIRLTLDLLPGTVEVHILSVRNECKELLFVVERNPSVAEPTLYAHHFASGGREEHFTFTPSEEQEVSLLLANGVGKYLYEPNASLLKAGAFKCLAPRLGAKKLHVSSHLYTSDSVVDFPGRVFMVDEVIPFRSKACKGLSKQIPQANITVRNFPLSVDELRKRTGITDGGSTYLFATTLSTSDKVLVRCRAVRATPD